MSDRKAEEDREREHLSALLEALPAPEPSAALLRAVAEIPLRHPAPARRFGFGSWSPLRSASRVALSLVLVALLGAITGGLSAGGEGSDEGVDDWAELSALSLAADLDQELAP